MTASLEGVWSPSRAPVHEISLKVLAVIADEATHTLISRVITSDELMLASDLAEGIALAETSAPDVAFIDVGLGDGAGLAMVHHLKALAPEATVFALATRAELEAGAHAVALGGAGLFLLPLGGDEVLNAVGSVRVRFVERALRMQLEQESARSARAAGWIARVAELADARDRNAAAQQLAEVFVEATAAAAAAVYLTAGERSTELVRSALTGPLDRAPAYGSEADILDFARREQLVVVPLALRRLSAGHLLLQKEPGRSSAFPSVRRPDSSASTSRRAPLLDGLVKLLATQATTALALLGERERSTGGAAMKDPASSAYSFAYYVDVAGREIDKARRHGRRFTIATIVIEPDATAAPERPDDLAYWRPTPPPPSNALNPGQVAEHLLRAVRDTDILARVDENEFHLLMPETAGLEAHACHRRMLSRVAGSEKRAGYLPKGLLVGVATFPHDGQGLAQLLRIARRRAEATKSSIMHRIPQDRRSIGEIFSLLVREPPSAEGPAAIAAPRALDLSVSDTVLLATSVIRNAVRGGAVFILVAHHDGLSLGAQVKALLASPRDDVVVHALDLRSSPGCDDIEALCVLAEHGAYALVGRNQGGFVKGIHAADPLLADFLAERLGRAAGLRVFG
ncbi:diguanylate cyclase domain-containing protein [Sorangium sp. So ce1078]|uniref:diguanylate cyclase domain-containing protein n=1 Tax=Sorangium sp. So ce1078 TaxID=3133329 RepID=UPI003F5F56F7